MKLTNKFRKTDYKEQNGVEMSEANIEVTYKLWLPRDQFDKKCIDNAQDMFFAILEVQDLLRQFRDLEE